MKCSKALLKYSVQCPELYMIAHYSDQSLNVRDFSRDLSDFTDLEERISIGSLSHSTAAFMLNALSP